MGNKESGARTWGTPFPILGVVFRARFERTIGLPAFPGGLLRGVFGAALRQRVCLTGADQCGGCPLQVTCAYPALMEPVSRDLTRVGLHRLHEGLPPPFIIRVPEPRPSAHLAFGMRLVGGAITALPLVLETWRDALAAGLGRERVRGIIESVATETGQPLPNLDRVEGAWGVQISQVNSHGAIRLELLTPLRLKTGGRLAGPADMTPRILVSAIIRRARLLAVHAEPARQREVRDWPVTEWLELAQGIRHRPHLRWQDWWRTSARQRRRMNLGGLVGAWEWEDAPGAIRKLLELASVIHVGKDASFGLGAVDIRPLGVSEGPPEAGSRTRMPSRRR